MMAPDIGASDLVGLNFGGERIVTVKRSLLLQFEDSMLAAMFSGRYEQQLERDKDGNVFLDHSPAVMIPLIDFLRAHRDSVREELVQLPDIAPESLRAWRVMIRFFGLQPIFTMRFVGIHTDVEIASLCGWTQIFCGPYKHESTLADLEPPAHLDANALLIGARRRGSGILALAAMGLKEVICAERDDASTQCQNGVFWYCYSRHSVGFAPTALVRLNRVDDSAESGHLRLSWTLPGLQHKNGNGGYRAGLACQLYHAEDWEKVIFAGSVKFDD